MKKLNPLKYLERTDKWYLGGGNRLLWTPPFPVWLDSPGFWDKAHYYNIEIEPVFTWTILDEEGREIPLRTVERRWDPSNLTTRYEMCDIRYEQKNTGRASHISHLVSRLGFTEVKCCLPNDVLASVIRIKNTSSKRQRLHLIAWTAQPSHPSQQSSWLTDVGFENGRIHFTKHSQSSSRQHFQFECTLGISKKVKSFSLNLSENSSLQPHWRLTPFPEKFRKGRLPNESKLSGITDDGVIFMALHTSIELKAKSEESIAAFFSAAPTRVEASSNYHLAIRQKDPVAVSGMSWNDFFSNVPYFECSDEYITRYYWYRWYGLRLITMHGKEGNYKHPCVCEGIGYFRAPISYSAMCHMIENRWMHTQELAQGSLLTFIENQREDGGFRGYIDPYFYRQEMFYHADWGRALRDLDAIHPDRDFLLRVYDGLKKYTAYFDRERDVEGSGLYDIDNHYETGQEFMHRYMAVDSLADRDNWGEVFRLKGVDVTVYIYELKKALAVVAQKLNRAESEVAEWNDGAARIKKAVLEKMWDPREQMFFDVDPATGSRTMVKAATCFYPYMTDIVSEIHVSGFKSHLFNAKEFWTRFPVPSSSADDEYFSAEAEWKGKRMNCPWNGRVWPMTNSHIAEALAHTAIRFNDRELRKKAAEFITKFISMMFFDGDPTRPNCFEHYNPFTGTPSIYRGVDDYQHSWVNDLIIKYVAGIRPFEGGIWIDPFPFHIDSVTMEEIMVRGNRISVQRKGKDFSLSINGKKAGSSTVGIPIVIKL